MQGTTSVVVFTLTLGFLLFVHANSFSIFHLLGLEHLRKKRDVIKTSETSISKCSASVDSLQSYSYSVVVGNCVLYEQTFLSSFTVYTVIYVKL